MKKILKLALTACMLAISLTSVSAATYTPLTATSSLDGTTVTIELPSGTYPTGNSELLARAEVVCPSPGIPGNVANQSSFPFYVLGTFNLSSAEVNTLKTKSVSKQVNALFDFGCSDLKVMTGTGNASKWTGTAPTPIPTTPTTPTTPGKYDLSWYSNGLFNIYESSRVVYVSERTNEIYMKGYAFEQFNNFSRKDSFVRELIFLDKNNPSDKEKAYRITLPSVYDPYLNANKNLNPNGQYNYSYAYYGGWMNLNRVRKYTNAASAPLVSLPRGEYLVYIRMSDGKRSNLTSMRSTKAEVVLPASFSLVPGSTDVLFTRR